MSEVGAILVAVFLMRFHENGALAYKSFELDMCPSASVLAGHELTSVQGRSTLDCAATCSRTEGCEAFNVCPQDLSGAVTCELLTDRNLQSCVGPSVAPSPPCLYVVYILFPLT